MAATAPIQNQGPTPANAPAPIQAFGPTAQVAPAYQTATGYTAAQADPYGAQQAYQQYVGMLQQSLQPTFDQQRLKLQGDLAARGISNSGAASYDMGNLETQQGATLAGAEAPFVQQMYGYQQGDVLANQAATNQAREFGAAAANTAAGANQNAANAATAANATAYNNDVMANYDAYNQYKNILLGLGANEQNALQTAWLNSFGPQSGVTNAMGQATGAIGSAYGNAFSNAQQAGSNAFGTIGNAYGSYEAALAAGA